MTSNCSLVQLFVNLASVAIASLGLVVTAIALKSNRTTASRQLRAYVGADKVYADLRRGDVPTIWVRLKNFGETPAGSSTLYTRFVWDGAEYKTQEHVIGLLHSGVALPARISIPPQYTADQLRDHKQKVAVRSKLIYSDIDGITYIATFDYHLIRDLIDSETPSLYLIKNTSTEAILREKGVQDPFQLSAS